MRHISGLMSLAIGGSLPLLIAQPSFAQLAQITDVRLIPIQDGLQVELVTSDSNSPQVFQAQDQNNLYVDIVGAQLALSDGEIFQQDNPVPSVASISIEQISDQEVRLKIVGTETTPPNSYLERAIGALKLDISTTPPRDDGDTSDFEFGDNLRIIVAEDPLSRYQVTTSSLGTRTDTDILDVPQGVQVVPKEVIEDQGRTSLADTLRNISGVSPGRTSGLSRATTPIIRGFETNNILRNGLRDDTLRLSSGVNNIERIEVLKGPSSVIFGAGNLSGTVNLVTEVPLDNPLYELEFKAGDNSFYGASIDLTGPLNKSRSIGYRTNIAYENKDTFRDFEHNEFFFIAPTLQVVNTEKTSLIVDFEHLTNRSYRNAPGLPAVSAIGAENNTLIDNIIDGGGQISEEDSQFFGTLDIRSNLGEPEISRSRTFISRIGYRLDHQLSENWKFRNEFLGSFQNTPESNFVVGVGFVQEAGQPNFSLLDRIYLENPSDRESYTVNTNAVGDFKIAGIDQKLLLGLELSRVNQQDIITQRLFLPFLSPDSEPFNIFDPNYDSTRFFNGTDLNIRPASDSTTRVTTIGLYGQSQINLTKKINLLLGGRLDFADQFFVDLVNRADTRPITTFDTAFSPRFGVVYKPIEDVSLYASYTQSFNPVIGRSELGEVFRPERGEQIEVGVKARLLRDRLSTSLALYRLRRSNVLTQDPTNPGFQLQVGEQGSDGIEFDIAGELLPGWNMIASYAFTDARIIQDNDFPEGLRLLNAPKHAASLWTTYEIQSGKFAGLGLGLGTFFQGDRNGDFRTPFIIPGYTRTDSAIFYRRGRFKAQLNIQNLFDIRYFEGARDQFRVIPGAPFTIFGSVSWEL